MPTMHRALAATGSALALTLTMAGCSSAPEIGDVDSDALIATCLDGAQTIAAEDDTTVEGTVSSVTATDEDDDGNDDNMQVHIIFDARDDNQTADPAACTMTVGGEQVQEFKVESPEDGDMWPDVEDATERWNDKHAEDWADGDGPDALSAPEPETGGSGYYYSN